MYTYWFLDIDGERKGAATFVLSFEYNMHSKCSYENISKQIDSTRSMSQPRPLRRPLLGDELLPSFLILRFVVSVPDSDKALLLLPHGVGSVFGSAPCSRTGGLGYASILLTNARSVSVPR